LTLGKLFAECAIKTLGKLLFADTVDVVCCMPSVTLRKVVAECFWAFAECPWHSVKLLYPVVGAAMRGTKLALYIR